MQQSSTLPSTGAFSGYDRLQLTFAYDWLGRRVRKEVFNLRTSTVKSARRYGYDGWNLIAEFDESSGAIGALQRSYTWGLDQTGSLAATGGVGALVQLSVHNGSTVTDYYPTYDANGNVAALVKNDGTLAAAYEYDPFGQSLRNDVLDSAVADNPFRFSTKFTDVETGLVYYGQRYYSPGLGRFINKDPIAEQGGLNLYAFVGNDPVNRIDVLGASSNLPYYGYGRYGLGYYDDPSEIWDAEDDTGSISYVQNGPVLGGGGGGGSSTDQTTSNKTQDAPNKSPCATLRALKVKALVEQNSYTNQAGGYVAGTNVERLSADQLTAAGISPSALNDSQSGFQSAIYLNHDTGGYFAAFAGTQDGTDWKTNIGQPLGVHNTQYSEAAAVGFAAATAFGAANVEGIGHSLGGGLNVVASLSGRFSGTNFNPAGVGWITALENNVNLFGASKSITAYEVPFDPLTQLVNGNLGPATDGREVMLPSPGGVPYTNDRHGMAGVISAIEKALAQNGCN